MSALLADALKRGLTAALPPTWRAEPEAPLLPPPLAERVGCMPRADLVLHRPDDARLVLEFEISRADPVANHAKVLAAYRTGALGPRDAFVSLLSPHVARGRRNLAALFGRQMREMRLPAFSVSLLPFSTPEEVFALNNHGTGLADLDYRRELSRVLQVAGEPPGEAGPGREASGHRIHFAGDVTDVMANVWAWNDEMQASPRISWARRAAEFLVYEPRSGLFAPAKFCAFVPVGGAATMTHAVYEALGERDPRFDGNRAWRHLVDGLAFTVGPPDGAVGKLLERWLEGFGGRVGRRQRTAVLCGPPWI